MFLNVSQEMHGNEKLYGNNCILFVFRIKVMKFTSKKKFIVINLNENIRKKNNAAILCETCFFEVLNKQSQ